MSIRITNAMMTNTTLMHINRNIRSLDTLIQQVESTKKIQTPSDNPIIASRALKFRTSVIETEQFYRNVQNGLAWMNVTESAFKNVVESLMKQINERCVYAATGTLTGTDKMALVAELRELLDQIGLEMNQTYAGRYVFSGLRTDEPPVLIEDNSKKYEITQTFELMDIEKSKSYQKFDPHTEAEVHNINVLKLAYKNAEGLSIQFSSPLTPPPAFPAFTLDVKNVVDPDAYTPGANKIHYIEETGELVMNSATAAAFPLPPSRLEVTYTKDGFKKGELNPIVYFPCTEITVPAYAGANAYQYNSEFLERDTMDSTKNMGLQQFQMEFATNTYVTINSHAKNTLTDKFYADMRRLIDFAESLTISAEKDLEHWYSGVTSLMVGGVEQNPYRANPLTGDDLKNAVTTQITNETAKLQSALYEQFNNMLYLVDRHSAAAMKEHIQMGTRMHRLELLQSRLEQDEESYTKLMSDNEDTDMARAIILKMSAEAAYTASLRANSNMVQLTLANFIG